jgi:ribosome-associated heat shock protein Hsp15
VSKAPEGSAGSGVPDGVSQGGKCRLDKWLWQARFFKTRGIATALVAAGRVRVNGTPVGKPARTVTQGDVLTFPQADVIRVIRVTAIGLRRGPATEAQGLYDDLTPAPEVGAAKSPENPRFDGKGRPSGRDRRNMRAEGIRSRSSALD